MTKIHCCYSDLHVRSDGFAGFILAQCLKTSDHGLYVWVGGQRLDPLDKDSHFVWKTDNSFTRLIYTNWHPEEPNNHGGLESCINMWPYEGNNTWNDQRCMSKSCFVCEYYV